MIRLALCLLFLLDGCATVAAGVFSQTSEEPYLLRPDTPAAQLTCNGAPCREVTGVKSTTKDNLFAFIAVAAAEGACTALAARSYHTTGADAPQVVADVCGGLLVWDLINVPLGMALNGLFSDHRRDHLDSHVELTLDGVTAPLQPWIPRIGQTQTFSARAALDRSLDFERRRAQLAFCHRSGLIHSTPLRYEVLPIAGDDGGVLQAALAAQLQSDLGDPSPGPTPGGGFHLQGTLVRNEGSATLELRWIYGPSMLELGRSSVTAASSEALAGKLVLLAHSVYDASCLS